MRILPVLAILGLTFVFVFVAMPTDAQTTQTTFSSNLTVGSTGSEVSNLQQYLVSEGFLVMPAGVAYGYFGPLTQSALAKWQATNGVSPTLGYWGPISRARYNELATTVSNENNLPSSSIISTPAPSLFSNNTPYAPGLRADKVILFRASPFEVGPGDSISLDGSSFSKISNKVYFNGDHEVSAISSDGVSLEVLVPTSLNEGEYEVTVSNSLGSSENPDIKVKIKVTDNPSSPPQIESASVVGETVTLVGSGFTSANNLFTTLGNSSGSISSNGTILTFQLGDLSRYNQTKQFTLGKYKAALWIYVQNEHGINKDPYQLEIDI